MNYHYIDYMIKERQREELEECERRRLLKSAGYDQEGLIQKTGSGFLNAVRRLIRTEGIPIQKAVFLFFLGK